MNSCVPASAGTTQARNDAGTESQFQDTHKINLWMSQIQGFPVQARNACPCGSRGRAAVAGIV